MNEILSEPKIATNNKTLPLKKNVFNFFQNLFVFQ